MAEDFFSALPFPAEYLSGVIVPGNFDGVHYGHQHMLRQAKAVADAQRLPVIALTFEPHPASFFSGGDVKPFRLASVEQKIALLKQHGADYVDILPFDAPLAGMSARDFIDQNIIRRCAAGHVVAGYDFVFGKGREGNGALLAEYDAFNTTTLEPFLSEHGFTVSSSRIREALHQGRPADAAVLAGRAFTTVCNVIKGDGAAGKQLGYPTANMDLGDYIRPKHGVYAVEAILRGVTYKAALNIGVRPTMFGTRECVEAHLIGDNVPGDFYGEQLTIIWKRFLRDEKKFDSFNDLKAAIAADVRAAAISCEYPG